MVQQVYLYENFCFMLQDAPQQLWAIVLNTSLHDLLEGHETLQNFKWQHKEQQFQASEKL